MIYLIEREQWIPTSQEKAFEFFSRPENLNSITPSWVQFRIHSRVPPTLSSGSLIDYTIWLAGAPLRWQTRIGHWDPPHAFVDLQERGPYLLWEHLHAFEPMGEGVLMTDSLRYRLPLGPIGRAVHSTMVRVVLERIFDHRFRAVREIFGEPIHLRSCRAKLGS